MTRETKVGIVVACSFLCLVAAVYYLKKNEAPAAEVSQQVVIDPTPVSASNEPKHEEKPIKKIPDPVPSALPETIVAPAVIAACRNNADMMVWASSTVQLPFQLPPVQPTAPVLPPIIAPQPIDPTLPVLTAANQTINSTFDVAERVPRTIVFAGTNPPFTSPPIQDKNVKPVAASEGATPVDQGKQPPPLPSPVPGSTGPAFPPSGNEPPPLPANPGAPIPPPPGIPPVVKEPVPGKKDPKPPMTLQDPIPPLPAPLPSGQPVPQPPTTALPPIPSPVTAPQPAPATVPPLPPPKEVKVAPETAKIDPTPAAPLPLAMATEPSAPPIQPIHVEVTPMPPQQAPVQLNESKFIPATPSAPLLRPVPAAPPGPPPGPQPQFAPLPAQPQPPVPVAPMPAVVPVVRAKTYAAQTITVNSDETTYAQLSIRLYRDPGYALNLEMWLKNQTTKLVPGAQLIVPVNAADLNP